MIDHASYRQFCTTDKQREIIDAVVEHGTRGGARHLGMAKSSVVEALQRIRKRAETSGYCPDKNVSIAPLDGYKYNRISTNYDDEGKIKQRWLIQTPEHASQLAIMQQISDGMTREIPKSRAAPSPKQTNEKLLNCYVLSDVHIGMLAWRREGGDDWDLKIAESIVIGCYQSMVENAPNADTAVICNLGDWVHSDGMEAVTPTSGHILDQDGRFPKVVDISTRLLRMIVDLALSRHKRVHLIIAEGNHDIVTSMHLRNAFRWGYENEPRLTIDDSVSPYYCHQFGRTMLGFHHGHLIKPEQMPGYFAAQYPKVWGDTTKREIHCGHRHHYQSKEHPGAVVTQHPTIAAKDAYASRGGYLSDRRAICTTYHREFGKVATTEVTPEMIL